MTEPPAISPSRNSPPQNHPVRREILEIVQGKPGIAEATILAMEEGTEDYRYHVDVLVSNDFVHRYPTDAPSGQARLFSPNSEWLYSQEAYRKLFRYASLRSAAQIVNEDPPKTTKSVAEKFPLDRSFPRLRARLALGYLTYADLVIRTQNGYRPTSKLARWLETIGTTDHLGSPEEK